MKKMNKILTTVLVIALAALTLVGCAKKDTSPVTTDGSTSMEKVIGTLGEAFKEKEGIDVTYNPTGSGSGIQAVSEGRCDIGLYPLLLLSGILPKGRDAGGTQCACKAAGKGLSYLRARCQKSPA